MEAIVTTRQRISTVYILLELQKGVYVDCTAFSNLKKLVKYLHSKELTENSYNSILRYMHIDGHFTINLEEVSYRIVGRKVR